MDNIYFHGLVYFAQCYSAYYIYKNRKEKFEWINILNSFIIINIFIGLLMGIQFTYKYCALPIYQLVNNYIITMFMADKSINTVELFAILTYGLIVFGIFLSRNYI